MFFFFASEDALILKIKLKMLHFYFTELGAWQAIGKRITVLHESHCLKRSQKKKTKFSSLNCGSFFYNNLVLSSFLQRKST